MIFDQYKNCYITMMNNSLNTTAALTSVEGTIYVADGGTISTSSSSSIANAIRYIGHKSVSATTSSSLVSYSTFAIALLAHSVVEPISSDPVPIGVTVTTPEEKQCLSVVIQNYLENSTIEENAFYELYTMTSQNTTNEAKTVNYLYHCLQGDSTVTEKSIPSLGRCIPIAVIPLNGGAEGPGYTIQPGQTITITYAIKHFI